MNDKLRFSVVIPTKNRASLIGRAIDSILAQSDPEDQIIIVDDGSTDGTLERLKQYGSRIEVVSSPGKGAGAARNAGISRASNELVAFLDSDDEWIAGKMQLQRELFKARPDILFCFSDFSSTDEQGNVYRNHLKTWHNDLRSWDEILGKGENFSSVGKLPNGFSDLKFHVGDMSSVELVAGYILTSSMACRREAAGKALYFAEDVPTYEDLECFGRLSLAGKAAYLDCETAWQHGEASHRLSLAKSLDRAYSRFTIIERVWGGNRNFVESHRELYDRVLAEAQHWYVSELISSGRLAEARIVLARVQQPPLPLRVLTSLPGAIVKPIIMLRRGIKKLF